MSSKTEKARQYALQGLPRHEIMEKVPCSKTTAFNALKWVETQRAKVTPKAPEIKVSEEEAKPEFKIEAEAPPEIEEEEVPEAPKEVPTIPIEVNVKDVEVFVDALFGKDTWGDYGMDKGKCQSLGRLWYPVFVKHWEGIVETWGLEIMALVGTLFIVGGHIRSVRGKKKKIREKKKLEEEKMP